jgi:hypothetical protein
MLHKRKTANINGKNPWFPQGCKSQCSHTLKTANIKSCYDPRSRLWYYKAYNRAFCRPYHTQMLLQASIFSNYFHVSAQLQPIHVYCSLKWIALKTTCYTQLYRCTCSFFFSYRPIAVEKRLKNVESKTLKVADNQL